MELTIMYHNRLRHKEKLTLAARYKTESILHEQGLIKKRTVSRWQDFSTIHLLCWGGGCGFGVGGINTLCFLTAYYSRRLLASSSQSAAVSLSSDGAISLSNRSAVHHRCGRVCVGVCARPQGPPAHTLLSAALCHFPQFHSSTRPPSLSCLSPLLGFGKVGPSAVSRLFLFVTRSKSTTDQILNGKSRISAGWNGIVSFLLCCLRCGCNHTNLQFKLFGTTAPCFFVFFLLNQSCALWW